MDWQAALKSIDELVFQQTGKRLSSLQVAILKGVLNGQKYAEIAKQYKCTKGHVKDEGYELWHVLSEVFGEEFNKSNFIATVERLGLANSQHQIIGNPIQIGYLNLCNNSETADLEHRESINTESNGKAATDSDSKIENILRSTQLKTVSKLTELGLTAEQISEAVDLPIEDVQDLMK